MSPRQWTSGHNVYLNISKAFHGLATWSPEPRSLPLSWCKCLTPHAKITKNSIWYILCTQQIHITWMNEWINKCSEVKEKTYLILAVSRQNLASVEPRMLRISKSDVFLSTLWEHCRIKSNLTGGQHYNWNVEQAWWLGCNKMKMYFCSPLFFFPVN